MGWVENEKARRGAGPSGLELCGAGRCSGGIGLTDWNPFGLLFTKVRVEHGRNPGELIDRLPEQIVGKPGHGHPAAPALAVKRADHVIGETGGIQGSGHDGIQMIGMIKMIGMLEFRGQPRGWCRII